MPFDPDRPALDAEVQTADEGAMTTRLDDSCSIDDDRLLKAVMGMAAQDDVYLIHEPGELDI
ncbi:MAG: hypothetical protein B7Y95_20645, partial [Rhizobiales bacterium 32-66-11]